MKKAILALAVLGAYGSSAFAQSSVTLYGLIDEGLVFQTNQRITAQNVTTGNPGIGGRRYSLDSGTGINGARWGLKGAEDLGGGLKAIFQLEAGLNLNNGALGQSGLEFGRQAYVGLSSATYGTVTFGRQYDSVVDAIGTKMFAAQIGTTPASHAGDVDNGNNSYRVNNAIKYVSPTFNGLTVEGLYSLGGVAGQSGRNQIYSFGGNYAFGGASVAAAFLHVNQPNSSFFSNSAVGAGSLGTATTSVTTPVYSGYANANSYQVAAAGGLYAFGRASIGVVYSNAQFQGLNSGLSSAGNGIPAGTGTGKAIFNTGELNFVWHWTPALQSGAGYSYTAGSSVQGIRNANSGAGNSGGVKYNQFDLSTLYSLSARTDVYVAAVYQIAAGTDSTGAHAQAAITGLTASSNNKQLAVRLGLRHKF